MLIPPVRKMTGGIFIPIKETERSDGPTRNVGSGIASLCLDILCLFYGNIHKDAIFFKKIGKEQNGGERNEDQSKT